MLIRINTPKTPVVKFSDIPAGRVFKERAFDNVPTACYLKLSKTIALGLGSQTLYEYPQQLSLNYELLPEGSVTITI